MSFVAISRGVDTAAEFADDADAAMIASDSNDAAGCDENDDVTAVSCYSCGGYCSCCGWIWQLMPSQLMTLVVGVRWCVYFCFCQFFMLSFW